MTSSNTLLSLVHPRRRGITRFNTPIASILHPANTWHIKYLIKWIDRAQAAYPASSVPYHTATQLNSALIPLQQSAPAGLWASALCHELEDHRLCRIHLRNLFALLLRISRTIQHLHKHKAVADHYPLCLQEPIDEIKETIAKLLLAAFSPSTYTSSNTPCTW